MVNYLKWGVLAALVAGVIIFRDQIKGGLISAGSSLGEAVGGGASGFIQGAVQGATGGIFGQPYDINKKGTVPLYDVFFNGIPKAYGDSGGIDPIVGRDNSNDATVTPYNREQVAKLEWSAAKFQTGLGGQARETARQFVASGANINVAEKQAKSFMTAFNNIPNGGHAQRVREAQQVSGTTVSPLALFRIYKAQGMTNTEAMRLVRERIA